MRVSRPRSSAGLESTEGRFCYRFEGVVVPTVRSSAVDVSHSSTWPSWRSVLGHAVDVSHSSKWPSWRSVLGHVVAVMRD